MILPSKKIPEDRALLTVGGQVLRLLDQPKTVSRLWNDLKNLRATSPDQTMIPYNWYILTLDLLFTLGAISLERGRIVATSL